MKVLFVHAPVPGARFSTSIAALSAWLKAHGHATALLIVPPDAGAEAFVAEVEAADPDVIAFSYMTCRAAFVARLVVAARAARPAVRLIAGGPHPTTYPRETLAALPLDAICVGEGEAPLLHFVERPGAPHAGLLRAGTDDPVSRWWAFDVDALPDWDRALFGDVRNDGNRYERAVGVALARGFCPYTCTFCGVDAYRRDNAPPTGPAHRLRSVERVLAEIARAREAVPSPDGFASWDEILPGGRAWQEAFFSAYRARVGLPFACQLRVEQVRPALVEAMVAGGCDYAVLGVETGDEAYRRKFLDKPFTNAEAIAAFALLHRHGIATYASFMIGLPFETPQALARTLELARALEATHLSWKYYTPERGTRLFALAERHGLVLEEWVDHPFGGNAPMIRMTHCEPRHLRLVSEGLERLASAAERATFTAPAAAAARPLTLELRA